MLLQENNVISELALLPSTAVMLTANGERLESLVVPDKENATKCPDVTTSTTVAQVFPEEPLLAAPSKEPKLKATVMLEIAFPSETNN